MNTKLTKINNKKFKSKSKTKSKNKTKTKSFNNVNKCLVKKSTLQPLQLSYFTKLATKIVSILEENNNQTKQKCIEILKNFPFCNKKDEHLDFIFEHYLQYIMSSKLFSKNEKKRRITSALIDLAWEYMTTRNADIGALGNNTHKPHNLERPVKKEYQYYTQVHNLDENEYVY